MSSLAYRLSEFALCTCVCVRVCPCVCVCVIASKAAWVMLGRRDEGGGGSPCCCPKRSCFFGHLEFGFRSLHVFFFCVSAYVCVLVCVCLCVCSSRTPSFMIVMLEGLLNGPLDDILTSAGWPDSADVFNFRVLYNSKVPCAQHAVVGVVGVVGVAGVVSEEKGVFVNCWPIAFACASSPISP